jgi:hypothetical protein
MNLDQGTELPIALQPPTAATVDESEEEFRLDCELQVLRRMRLALVSTLHLLEAARDDLQHGARDIDQLAAASARVRRAFAEMKKQL